MPETIDLDEELRRSDDRVRTHPPDPKAQGRLRRYRRESPASRAVEGARHDNLLMGHADSVAKTMSRIGGP